MHYGGGPFKLSRLVKAPLPPPPDGREPTLPTSALALFVGRAKSSGTTTVGGIDKPVVSFDRLVESHDATPTESNSL
jgi:hypothetical protein